MPIAKTTSQVALPPGLEAHYAHTRRVWSWALCTPVVYLIAVSLLDYFGKAPFAEGEGASPLDFLWTNAIIAGIAICFVAALIWHRARSRATVVMNSDDPQDAIQRWSRVAYAMAIESDCLALLGVFYFLFTGYKMAVLAGGLAAYAGYLVACPRREDLLDLKDVEVEDFY